MLAAQSIQLSLVRDWALRLAERITLQRVVMPTQPMLGLKSCASRGHAECEQEEGQDRPRFTTSNSSSAPDNTIYT
jgi:hypothetical protein